MSHRPDLASDHPWRRGAMRQANFTPLWAVPPQALGLEYAGHFNWALRRGHRSRPLSFAPPATPHALLAVGLLTMDSELAAEKRTLARSTFFSTFSALRGAAYEARYLLPRLPPRATDPLAAENATHGDLLRLATREGRDRCWLKVILWLDHALAAFPRATFVGITDDDVYLQLHRIALELAAYRSVPHVYWGQPMWMSHWNHTRFEGARFGGYLRGEGAAFGEYERAVREAPPWARRAAAGAAEGAHACDKPTGARARAEAAGMPLGGPFIFMNTDLSVFSADLARAILRGRCLRHFKADFRAAFPPQHGEISDDALGALLGSGGPPGSHPCYPMIDQLLGWLVTHAGVNVTLVEVQLMAQGLPWMQLKSKPAGAHTLYVHKLSTPWQFTYFDALLSTEPAALLRRSCAPCAVPGRAVANFDGSPPEDSWIADGSPSVATYAGWTCCTTAPRYEGTDATKVCDARRATTRRRQQRELRAHHAAAARRANSSDEAASASERPLLLADGYCAATDDVPNQRGAAACGRTDDLGAKGYFQIDAHPHVATIEGCAAACRACDACRYISFSPAYLHRECAWYRTCDLHRLSHIGSEVCPTYVSARVPKGNATRAVRRRKDSV